MYIYIYIYIYTYIYIYQIYIYIYGYYNIVGVVFISIIYVLYYIIFICNPTICDWVGGALGSLEGMALE